MARAQGLPSVSETSIAQIMYRNIISTPVIINLYLYSPTNTMPITSFVDYYVGQLAWFLRWLRVEGKAKRRIGREGERLGREVGHSEGIHEAAVACIVLDPSENSHELFGVVSGWLLLPTPSRPGHHFLDMPELPRRILHDLHLIRIIHLSNLHNLLHFPLPPTLRYPFPAFLFKRKYVLIEWILPDGVAMRGEAYMLSAVWFTLRQSSKVSLQTEQQLFLDRGLGMYYNHQEGTSSLFQSYSCISWFQYSQRRGIDLPRVWFQGKRKEYCLEGKDEGGCGWESVSVEGGAVEAGLMLDLWILGNVCICLRQAEAGIKGDRMLLLRGARPKGEGMPAAQPALRAFFGRFCHDSIILITSSKHYDLLIIGHGSKPQGAELDTSRGNQRKVGNGHQEGQMRLQWELFY